MEMTVGGLFSGVGGFELGFQQAGFTVQFMCELDPYCRRVLAHHFPGVPIYDDVRTVQCLPTVDVLTGGFPCFPAGTLILTNVGLIPIEEIRSGDYVLTHAGRYRRVIAIGSTEAQTIILKGHGHPGLVTTPEHPFLASRRCSRWRSRPSRGWDISYAIPKWRQAKDMAAQHWASPVDFPSLPVPKIQILNNENVVPDFSPSFWWLVGLWLGDGWVDIRQRSNRPDGQTNGKVIWCSAREPSVIATINKHLHLAGLRFCQSDEKTVRRYIVSSKPLARWLHEQFGQYSDGKRLPSWLLGLPVDARQAIFAGYVFADGSTKGQTIKSTSINKRLALGMKLLGQSIGMSVAMYRYKAKRECVIEGRKVSEREQWQNVYQPLFRSSFILNNHRYGRVRAVLSTNRTEQVYNIEVEEDNSYVADGISVHNCQDVSLAGRRAGLAGERSGLFHEFVRAADQLAPRWLVLENVPGLLSSQRGRDFQTVLRELTGFEPEIPQGGWRNSGVCTGPRRSLAWCLLDSQYFGLPQRRERVFLVAGPRVTSGFEVLFDAACGGGDLAPSREAEEDITGTLGATAGRSRGAGINAKGGSGRSDFESETFIAYRTNAAGQVMDQGDRSAALTNPTDKNNQIVFQPRYFTRDQAGGQPDDIAAPLTGEDHNGDSQQVVAFAENQRAEVLEKDVMDSLKCGGGKPGQGYSAVRIPHGVRRLTPGEFERLQGFPDSWTKLDARTADSPRYKAMGNAVSVPVIQWIARRILEVDSQ